MIQIAIDGIAISHPQPGGFHTYATNLVEQLIRLDQDNRYLLLVDRPVSLDIAANWRVETVPRRVPLVGVAVREQFSLPLRVWSAKTDLLHSLCGTGPLANACPQIVTLLDTIEFSTSLPSPLHTRTWAMRIYNRFVQKKIVHRAKAVITISQYSKKCIADRFNIPKDRIFVTHLAPAEHFFHSDPDQCRPIVQKQFGVTNYILALASASPRKNIERLLVSYQQLDPTLRKRSPLVIICTHPTARKSLEHIVSALGLEYNVQFLDRVLDEQLVALQSAAALFVFPSLEEGFGLPPLEAMASRTPVVASNTSSMPEILGDAALLVPPTNTNAIATAMTTVLTTPSLADQLIERGLARSRQFSWEKTARQTMDIYKLVAQRSTPR